MMLHMALLLPGSFKLKLGISISSLTSTLHFSSVYEPQASLKEKAHGVVSLILIEAASSLFLPNISYATL
jgi:hypothetical protein